MSRRVIDLDDEALQEAVTDAIANSMHMRRYVDIADAVLAVLAEVGVPAVTEGHTVWDAAWRAAGRRRRFTTDWEAAP